MTDSIQAQIDALKAEIAEIRRIVDQAFPDPRLGPRPETQVEIDARTVQLIDAARQARPYAELRAGMDPAARARVDARVADTIRDMPPAEPVNRSSMSTTSGEPVDQVKAEQTNETGQHKAYVVLSAEERAKGWVRPYRDQYKHVGTRPKYPTRDLTAEECERYKPDGTFAGYVTFEPYPDGSPEQAGSRIGRFWTAEQLQSGCGAVTSMGRELSETYARDPKFYGQTFCCSCNRHLPVAEFVWTADGCRVGS